MPRDRALSRIDASQDAAANLAIFSAKFAPYNHAVCAFATLLFRLLFLACNFPMASLICFRYWEFWSLGGLENHYNILRISESPNLPAAKANIKVILSSFTFLLEARATS